MKRNILFGEKVAYCREFLQLSKKEMAELLDVSPSTYSKYENGISMPSVNTLYLLARIIDMSMEDFLDENVSLEEFKEVNSKTIIDMYLELQKWIQS